MRSEYLNNNRAQVEQQRNHVDSIILEYKAKLHTPELILTTFQQIWTYRSLLITDSIEQPLAPIRQLNRAQEKIHQLEAKGRRLGYMPHELSTQTDRHKLGAMFPKMDSHSVIKGNTVTNERVSDGWLDCEADIKAPYLGTRVDVPDLFASQGRHPMTLSEYITFGQDSKDFTDKYFDQDGTWTALPDSQEFKGIIFASFTEKGKLRVIRWSESPIKLFHEWGWRSVGTK